MLGMSNGAVQPQPASDVPSDMQEPPALTINAITLSWKQIAAAGASVIGAIWSFYVGGYLFVPAKESDLKALTGVVQKIQETVSAFQAENDKTISRLTMAIDNLSGLVSEVKSQRQRVIIQKPKSLR